MRKFGAALAAFVAMSMAPAIAAAETIFFHQEGVSSSFSLSIPLPGAGKYNIVLTTEGKSTSGAGASYRAEWDYYAGTPENPGPMTPLGNEFTEYNYDDINGLYGVYLQFEVPADYFVRDAHPVGYTGLPPGTPLFMLMEFKNPTTFVTFNSLAGPTAYSITISAAPEPGTWALMILGFGAAGAMLRRQRAAALA